AGDWRRERAFGPDGRGILPGQHSNMASKALSLLSFIERLVVPAACLGKYQRPGQLASHLEVAPHTPQQVVVQGGKRAGTGCKIVGFEQATTGKRALNRCHSESSW